MVGALAPAYSNWRIAMDVATKVATTDEGLKSTKNLSIEGLLGMTDAQLMEVLGFNQEIEAIRTDLTAMSKMSGKAREEADRQITDMLSPDISSSRIHWAKEDAQRAGKRSGKDELADESPSSVMD